MNASLLNHRLSPSDSWDFREVAVTLLQKSTKVTLDLPYFRLKWL